MPIIHRHDFLLFRWVLRQYSALKTSCVSSRVRVVIPSVQGEAFDEGVALGRTPERDGTARAFAELTEPFVPEVAGGEDEAGGAAQALEQAFEPARQGRAARDDHRRGRLEPATGQGVHGECVFAFVDDPDGVFHADEPRGVA